MFTFGALFDRPITNEKPVYTVGQLNTAFGHLETYYGDCSAIFREEGISIELCQVTRDFTKRIETRARALVIEQPDIGAVAWQEQIFSEYNDFFPESKWALMFSALTQTQMNFLLTRIVWWAGEYDESRTFAEFKAILNGE